MKNVLIILLVFLTHHINSQVTTNGWEWCYGTPQGNKLNDVGKIGSSFYFCGSFGTFLRTADTGKTWFINHKAGSQFQMPPYNLIGYRDLNKIHFFDSLNGIAVGLGCIQMTSDAGANFIEVDAPYYQADWTDMKWINSSTGFVCGKYSGIPSGTKLMKSTNRGLTWVVITEFSAEVSSDSPCLWTADGNLIFVTSMQGHIFRSTDSGITWLRLGAGTTSPITVMNFSNSSIGFLSATSGYIIRTTDSGDHWVSMPIPFYQTAVSRIMFVGNDVYIAGDQRYIYRSSNLGSSWDTLGFIETGKAKPWNVTGALVDVYGLIITIGFGGEIYLRYPSANRITFSNYLKMPPPYPAEIPDIITRNRRTWVAFSPDQNQLNDQIITSSDFGLNWTVKPIIPQSVIFSTISVPNDMTVWAANRNTQGGVIIRTTNMGNSWNNITPPVINAYIMDISFINENTGWIIYSGMSGKTTNGGVSWSLQSIPLSSNEISSFFINENTGWIVGGGTQNHIHKTVTGGQNWAAQQTPNSNSLNSIIMIDSLHGYACGSRTILRTTNGGFNWLTLSVPSQMSEITFNSMSCYGTSYIAVSSPTPYILYSSNSGQNWTVSYTGTNELVSVSIYGPDSVLTIDRHGNVLRVYTDNLVPINNNQEVTYKFSIFNYPNPFNPTTNIRYSILHSDHVLIEIFDVLGRRIEVLADEKKFQGSYELQFNGASYSSGIYFYRITTSKYSETKKMVLLK